MKTYCFKAVRYNCFMCKKYYNFKNCKFLHTMARETWVQSQVESSQRLKKKKKKKKKKVLDVSLLNTQHYKRYESRVKWSNPGKRVALSPTPWCSSYRKGNLRVTLDYGRPTLHTTVNCWKS